jgi:ribonuclease HI
MPTLPPDTLVAYTDGGSRGNPGPAGFGVRFEEPNGTLLEEFGASMGTATNNVAEYRGLIAALGWAADHGYRRLHVRSDSELLVRQMRGEYRVKNPGLKPLHQEARALIDRFEEVTFEHVPREMNRHADRLANLAMDEAEKQVDPLRAPSAKPATRQGNLPFGDRLPHNRPPKK